MNKKTHTVYKNHKHFSSFQKLCHIDKAYEKKRNICGFNKLCFFNIYIYIVEKALENDHRPKLVGEIDF